MKRIFTSFSLIAGVLAIASCSTGTTNRQAWNTHQVGEGREPAGEPRVYWQPVSKSFSVASPSGIRESFTVDVNQIKEWTETIPYQDTCYEWRSVPTPSTCEGYKCSGGTGKSEAWDAFYSAPKAQKPGALANAIKGVGDSSARKLIDAGYFNRKPRSWDAFVSELESAANAGVIGQDVVYQATVRYKTENVINLGYDANSCTTYTYPCTIYTDQLVPYSCTKTREETYQRTIDTLRRSIDLTVSGSQLQSFEADQVNVTVGHDAADVRVDAGPFNRYNASVQNMGQATTVKVTGVQRMLVDLPRAAVRAGKLEPRDGKLYFGVKVDSKYIPNDSKDQMVLKYTVKTCKTTLGLCMGSYKPQPEVTVPVTGEETVIPIELAKKTKAKVTYSVARKNSPWYNDHYLADFETDTASVK